MDYANNALYHLIRTRAGTKMLRQAESVNMYDQVSHYLYESCLQQAVELYKNFEAEYPIGSETPMGFIWMDELEAMDSKELQDLPWIYVFMLQAMAAHSDMTTDLLKEKLAASKAAAWRYPLPEGVAAADAFKHTYDTWVADNQWVESFITDLAGDSSSHVYACGCKKGYVCNDCTSGGGDGPAPPRYDYFGVISRRE